MSDGLGLSTPIDPGLPGPYIIGATGGSGTRVIARIARRGGMFIGANLNESDDALEFGDFSDHWINTYLTQRESPEWPETRSRMTRDLRALVERHLASLDPGARVWGWKEPRSIYLLPFFSSQFPGLKFLHVVRDGRDMACSANQNQLRKHGPNMLRSEERTWSQQLQSIALWSRVNQQAVDYGEKALSDRYLRVRFEDLCSEPVRTIGRIFDFFDLKGEIEQVARLEVQPPETLGRWQTLDAETVAELHRVGEGALRRFGYWPPRSDRSDADRHSTGRWGSLCLLTARRLAGLLGRDPSSRT